MQVKIYFIIKSIIKEIDTNKFSISKEFINNLINNRIAYLIDKSVEEELHLIDRTYFYMGKRVPLLRIGLTNNVFNIYTSWMYDIEIYYYKFNKDYIDIILECINSILHLSRNNLDKYLEEDKPTVVKYYRLLLLNKLFKVKVNMEVKSSKLNLKDVDIQLSIEENLFREFTYINDFKTTYLIKESIVEDYICSNMNLIDASYKVIKRQFPIKDAFIDILCKDSNNRYIIVELKIASSKSLVWQSIYYPIQLKKALNLNYLPKMVIISPELKQSVLLAVKNSLKGNIDIYTYNLTSYKREIENFEILNKKALSV